MKKISFLMMATMILLSSCNKDDDKDYVYENGIYKAEDSGFPHGWKAYMEAEIKNDKLVSVDFDYRNADNQLKSQTTTATYPMDPHPTVWLPAYEAQLLKLDLTKMEPDIDGVSGATSGTYAANALLGAILKAAKTGDKTMQVIVVPEPAQP